MQRYFKNYLVSIYLKGRGVCHRHFFDPDRRTRPLQRRLPTFFFSHSSLSMNFETIHGAHSRKTCYFTFWKDLMGNKRGRLTNSWSAVPWKGSGGTLNNRWSLRRAVRHAHCYASSMPIHEQRGWAARQAVFAYVRFVKFRSNDPAIKGIQIMMRMRIKFDSTVITVLSSCYPKIFRGASFFHE